MLRAQMDTNYFTSAYMAHAALRAWLKPSNPPKSQPPRAIQPNQLIFTSTVLAFLPLLGYSPYTPPKCALRALSDTLSQELLLYSKSHPVSIHTIYPGTIHTPALQVENLTKPDITKKLEEDDKGQTPDEVAIQAVEGLERGDESISTSWLVWALKCGSLGWSRKSGWGVVDWIMGSVLGIVAGVVRWDMEGKIVKWGQVNGHSGSSKR